nr:chorismate mutase [Pirellulaceae bacterium]
MQKRRPEKKADSSVTVNTLRRKADSLGRDLVKLLHEYAHCSERLSRLRHQQGGPLYDPEAEQLAVQQALESKKGPL